MVKISTSVTTPRPNNPWIVTEFSRGPTVAASAMMKRQRGSEEAVDARALGPVEAPPDVLPIPSRPGAVGRTRAGPRLGGNARTEAGTTRNDDFLFSLRHRA